MTDAMCARVMDEMIKPTLRALKAMGAPYKGVLYAGVMVTKDGPKLVEYNARFGDPECQVLMLRMMSDIVPALIACADGQLKNFSLRWFDDAALTVIMATKGYPGDYGKGSVIAGLDEAAKVEGVEIFHAGTGAKDGQHSRQWRARAERLRDRQDRDARRSGAPMRRSTASTGRKAFAAATSAGRRWSARKRGD